MNFDSIPHSKILLNAIEQIEASGQSLPASAGDDVAGAMQALKQENDALKERQQKIIQRIDRLINRLEKASSWAIN